ncbi:MAG: DUF937 domain-containing protein [Acidobacteriota bacterium]|nr:DUF937 domain-containing protein [Acidobacteriota bacterium]
MFSLEDLLGQQQGGEAVSQISNQIGANPTMTNAAIQMALPMLLNGLANNTKDQQGAESLNTALQQHEGGILDNLGSLFGGGNQTSSSDGLGILGHIFGGSQGAVAQQVSQKSGMDIGQVAQLLITLAPIVMGFLGKKKQEQNLDASGLQNMLGQQQQQMQASGNPVMDMVSGMLDKNHDGSSMDDLASMAMNYFRK